jgi:capsular exopolysaccharide synthesis family protein
LLQRLEAERDEAVSLHRYLRLLLRRRWLILGVAAAVIFAALLQVLTTTPLYRAFATVQIDPESPDVLSPDAAEPALSAKAREEYLTTQARKLQTRELARRVIDRLDLAERPDFTSQVRSGFFVELFQGLAKVVRRVFSGPGPGVDERVHVDRFLEHLGVQVLRDTRLVEVSYTSADPELAATVVNTLVEEFIEQNLESRYRSTTKVADFLSSQLADLKSAVEESEARLIEYARANDIVNLNERESINVGKLADLNDELTRVEGALIGERARYRAIAGASPEDFPEMLRNPTVDRLEEQLSEERSRLAGLSSHHGPEWPAVKELRRRIEGLEAELAAEKRRAIARAREDYELAVDRHRRLVAAVEEQRRVVDRLNDDSIEYHILEREVESNKQLYEGLLQRLKEAGVSAGLSWSNIHLADRAEVPRRPAYPRRSLALAVAVVLGLFLGIGAVFVRDAFDDTFESTEEVTQLLRLPALGIIPEIDGIGVSREAGESERALTTRGRSGAKAPVIAYRRSPDWQAPAWEAYRSLRTSLLLSHSGQPPRTILVTSPLPGEGKSTTVANTAIVLAQTGARTLILDLDMRKPTMADLFGASNQRGMSTFLTGNSDLSSLVAESGFPNLYLVSAGPPPPNPAELVGSSRLSAGLDFLGEYFDHILIDSPPCLEITDALVLSTRVDGLLLVVRGGKTPREVVRRASDRLQAVGGKILGVLVNAVDVRRSEYGYYHSYYRSYYARGGSGRSGERKSA